MDTGNSNRIDMTDNSQAEVGDDKQKSLQDNVAEQGQGLGEGVKGTADSAISPVTGAAGGAGEGVQGAAQSATSRASTAMEGATGEGEGGGGDGNINAKVEEAMSKGEASGLLNSEQLQDGSLQEKVKEAMAKGESGPGGLLDKVMGKGEGGGGMSNPLSNYGNSFGNAIQEKLSPVGNVAGKGFEQVGRPVGGVVEPLAGGLMKSGGAWGETLGVGAGNMDKKNARAAAENEEMKKEFGGKEQTGDNPLGL